MKQIIAPQTPLSLSVNGATITPELARPFTKKRNGHHVMLRVTASRKVVAYLATDIYILPAAFNAKTKQIAEPNLNSELGQLLSRAGKIVGATLVAEQIKSSWEKEKISIQNDSLIDAMEVFAEWGNYTELTRRAEYLEKELVIVHAAIKKMEVTNPEIAPIPLVTIQERKEYTTALNQFLAEHEATLSKRDYAMWVSWSKRLNECAEYHKLELSLFSFDIIFYSKYKSYLMGVRGNKLNTFGANVKKLKSFLKYAEGEGYNIGKGHKNKKFAITEEDKAVVYLDDSELNMLWDYQIIKPEYTKQIHLCLFQSLTGLRISDVAKRHYITKLNIENETVEYLTAKCQKTEGTYKVPLSLDSRIKEILEANKYDMDIISEPYYNRTIKEIVAELYVYHNMPMPKVEIANENMAGVVITEQVNKVTELGTHSNRRSFVSRHINSNEFNHVDILEMLGSTDMKELQKYIQVDSGKLNEKATANATARRLYMRVA